MTIEALLQAMYDSPLGTGLAESLLLYPLVEGTHLLSLTLSFGLIVLVDLHLAGIALKSQHAAQLLSQLRPLLWLGFSVTFITGILLVFASGPDLVANFAFPSKVAAIIIALVNAAWFEWRYGRQISQWPEQRHYPTGVRLAAGISLIAWSSALVLGRLIPYLDSGVPV